MERPLWFFTLALLASAAGASPGLGPTPLSPGELAGEAGWAPSCPTFEFSASEKAAFGHELVVLNHGEAGTVDDSQPATVVLRVELPAGATRWSPPLGQCLQPGQGYAWMVRAVSVEGGASEWSPSARFDVSLAPAAAEVEWALGILRRLERSAVGEKPAGSTVDQVGGRGQRVAAGVGSPTVGLRVSGRAIASEFQGDGSALTNIGGGAIANGSITGLDIQDDSISSADVVALNGGDIQDGTLTSIDIENNTLFGADILNESLTGDDIANDSLTGDDIQDGSVTTSDIADASLTGNDILNQGLTGDDILDYSLAPRDIGCRQGAPAKVGAWCIGDAQDADTWDGANSACWTMGMQLCPLAALLACDILQPGNSDCTAATDLGLPSEWLWCAEEIANDVNAFTGGEARVFAGQGNNSLNEADYQAKSEANTFYCCTSMP